jgi:pyruvate ferredoxin oxidoreductase gamma subunit
VQRLHRFCLPKLLLTLGKFIQGFPEYGPERMGAPITAYNRISDEKITIHSNIYEPDYVVVVDETLIASVDVLAGLKEGGAVVINSSKDPEEIRPLLKGYTRAEYTPSMREPYLLRNWDDISPMYLC